MNPTAALSFRTWLAAAGSFGLVLAVAVGLVAWAGWEDVMVTARRIDGATLVVVLATSLACYGIRFLRWQGFTRALGHSVPWFANLRIFVAGLAMTWTPGKGGELLRGLFLARHGVPFARSILLFYWDRLSDLGGMLLLALISTLLLASGYIALVPAALVITFVLWLLRPGGAVFTQVVVWARNRLPARHGGRLDGLARLGEGDTRFTPGLAAVGALAGALAYAMQALGLLLVARVFGTELAYPQALLVMSVSTLAGAAVLLPAGAGVVETTSVGLLVAQKVALPEAVAVGLVHRATTFWFAMALGGVALAGLFTRNRHD